MKCFCPTLLLALLLAKSSSRCRADCSDDNRIPCTKCSKKNGGVGVHYDVERLMQEQTDTLFGDNSYRYKLGGVFYDEEEKLTVSLVASKDGGGEANESVKRANNGGGEDNGDDERFKNINADVFKKIILDVLGPTVILSQTNDRKAEKLLRNAQKKAEKDAKKNAKKNGAPPPSSETIDAEIRKAILDHKNLMKDMEIAFVPARFSFEELQGDYERVMPEILKSKDIALTDLDESKNHIFISALNEVGLRHAEQIVDEFQIDKKKVLIAIEERGDFGFEPDSGPSLQDRVRPVGGGLFIEVPKFGSWQRGCSIGFVAKREQTGEKGFVTASHCSGTMASVDGQQAYQDQIYNLPPPVTSLVGIETKDTIVQPDTGRLCSDSAFFTFEPPYGNSHWPRIYKTEEVGSNVLKPNPSQRTFREIRIGPNSLTNEVVYKVGRRTGLRRGRVVRTCVDATLDYDSHFVTHTLHCQDVVHTTDNTLHFQWKGDSGAAMIWTLNPDTSDYAWIRGISYGRYGNYENCLLPDNSDCTGFVDAIDIPPYFWDHYVSPISNVECDHGKLLVSANDFYGPPDPNASDDVSPDEDELSI